MKDAFMGVRVWYKMKQKLDKDSEAIFGFREALIGETGTVLETKIY